jgi:Zn-dependent protease with chaperone function
LTLPFTFLTGLLVLFANRELQRPIVGSGRPEELLASVWLLALPGVLALLALRGARGSLVAGRSGRVPPRALLRLAAAATPIGLHLVLGPGGWSDLAARFAGGSQLLDVLLLLAPLFAAEVPRLAVATAAELYLEAAEEQVTLRRVAPAMLPHWTEMLPIVRSRLSWPLLLLMPCALFGAAIDLLRLDRELYTLFLTTTPGATVGTLVFFAFASLLLPYWFRVAFGVRRGVPEPAGTRLRQTAAALGFPPDRVLYLPTGMRAMNAMMVGPLPFGRFLCVTDGIVRLLDIESLTGVVAHEVGHARNGHPLLLMTLAAVVPLLLPGPLRVLEVDRLEVSTQALLAVVALVVLWTTVRGVAHRFEHEADAASVRALGAGPCTRALMVVSRAALPGATGWLRRHFTLHPEESMRWRFMQRYESEPAFRAAFDARGGLLRGAAAAVLVAAVGMAAWSWTQEWPFERLVWRLHAGDVVGAAAAAGPVADAVPERWRDGWERAREELAVVRELAPSATGWSTAQPLLAASAWSRGVAVLLQSGPRAARPWLALALAADPTAPLVHRTVVQYCEAAADEDAESMAAAAAVVRRLGVPAGLEPVFLEPPSRGDR